MNDAAKTAESNHSPSTEASVLSDLERIDWLETQDGAALVSDDGGRWAVVWDGMQNIPEEEASDIATSFFIQAKQWKSSVREAIDAALNSVRGAS